MTEQVLGSDGTIFKGQQIRYAPEPVNRPGAQGITGQTSSSPRAHMQNFFDCVRSGKETNCPFGLGFRVSIASRMAVDSYRLQRTLRWDSQKEEIIS